MPLVLVISSYVAASRVGGAVAPFALGPMKVDPVLVPASLFGRHPGKGPPGGSPVAVDDMRRMIEGVEADGLFPMIDAVITGHFFLPEQVQLAAETIDRIRETPRKRSHDNAPARPIVIVDPIMGDTPGGLYIKLAVADALIDRLVPRADILTPNLWEFAKLTGLDHKRLDDPACIAEAARQAGHVWLITSVPTPMGTGAMLSDGRETWLAETPRIGGHIPNGTGDLLTLRFAGGLVTGQLPEQALAQAVGATHAVIDKAMQWSAPELPLAACSDLLAAPPSAALRKL